LVADPFGGDGLAIGRFLQGLAEGRYPPEVFTDDPSNAFAGRDVTAIALQLPDAAFGSTRIGLWGRISLSGDRYTPQPQVSRIGQAMATREARPDQALAGQPARGRPTGGAGPPGQVALAREQDYRELKGALGLDHFEGRGFLGWHHHVTLVSVAHGFLTLERLRSPNLVASA
jgi:hypothetical protein